MGMEHQIHRAKDRVCANYEPRQDDGYLPTAIHVQASTDGLELFSDLPQFLPIGREEVVLLRAFLSAEISAVLTSDDTAG